MGPEATADLFQKLIRNTLARTDQDHLRIIIDNNPQIPDRTRAILGTGVSPRDEMVSTALNLQRAGAGIITKFHPATNPVIDGLIMNSPLPLTSSEE